MRFAPFCGISFVRIWDWSDLLTWIWYGKDVPTSSSMVGGNEDAYMDQEENDSNMVEMMSDLEEEFVERPELFEKMIDEAETP